MLGDDLSTESWRQRPLQSSFQHLKRRVWRSPSPPAPSAGERAGRRPLCTPEPGSLWPSGSSTRPSGCPLAPVAAASTPRRPGAPQVRAPCTAHRAEPAVCPARLQGRGRLLPQTQAHRPDSHALLSTAAFMSAVADFAVGQRAGGPSREEGRGRVCRLLARALSVHPRCGARERWSSRT